MTLDDIQALHAQGIQDFHIMMICGEWYVSATNQAEGVKVEIKANARDLPSALETFANRLARLTRQGVIGPANQIEHAKPPAASFDDDIPF